MSSAIPNSIVSVGTPRTRFLSGGSLKQVDHCVGSNNLIFISAYPKKAKSLKSGPLRVQASRDDGRPGLAGIFVGGFILGGVVVGALSCVYASQISEALAGVDRKELLRKLPKFVYDEEKALEKTRKMLSSKIAELNKAIDDATSDFRAKNIAMELHTPAEVDYEAYL